MYIYTCIYWLACDCTAAPPLAAPPLLYLVVYTVSVLRYSAEIAVAYNNTGGSPHGVAQRDAGQTEIIKTCAMRYTAVLTRFR